MIKLTEKELNQLHWVIKEIELLKVQKQELNSMSYIKAQKISGMPFGSGISDSVSERAIKIREVEELIEIKITELFILRGRIERYINEIEDVELRLIIRLRSINNLSWDQIGEEIGMDRRTASRKYYGQFAHNAHR